MRSIIGALVSATLVGCFIMMWSAYRLTARQLTPVTVTRIYTGSDGQTHAETNEVRLMPLPPSSNGGEQSDMLRATGLQFRRWPPGWVNNWHAAPRRQYVITLSGRGEIEMIGGQKIRSEPGKVVLAEDVTGKGHITRTIGTEDWISLAIPVPDK